MPTPLPVPAPRDPADNLRVDVLSAAPLVVTVSGEIDIASATKLQEELLGVMRRCGARLALDLGGVTFMDCAGINALLATRRHARLEGGWVCVVQASRRVRKLLILTGLDQEFRPGPLDGKPTLPGASDARREAPRISVGAAPLPGSGAS